MMTTPIHQLMSFSSPRSVRALWLHIQASIVTSVCGLQIYFCESTHQLVQSYASTWDGEVQDLDS